MVKTSISTVLVVALTIMSIPFTSFAGSMTLEQLCNRNPKAMSEIKKEAKSHGVKVKVKGNTVTYIYDLKRITTKKKAYSPKTKKALTKALKDNTETTAVKQAANKTWADMVEHGGLGLMIAQIRALANKAAQNALKNAGKKGIEDSVFRSILEQLGKKLSLKNTSMAMPVIGGAVGALFDTTQMKRIVTYADIFYNKRFIEEKSVRVNALVHPDKADSVDDIIDAEYEVIQ